MILDIIIPTSGSTPSGLHPACQPRVIRHEMNNWYYTGRHGFIIFELETMKMMIERVLAIVNEEATSAEIRFRTQYEAVTDGDDPSLDIARDELWISQAVIPRNVMNSLFSSLFALFENEMVTVCELLGKKAGGEKDFANFKNGIGVSKVKNYLEKHFNVKLALNSKWQDITYIKDLRNMIAHNNGRFKNRDPSAASRLSKYIETSEWLSLDDTQNIVIEKNYFANVDKILRAFLKEFFSELEAKQLI